MRAHKTERHAEMQSTRECTRGEDADWGHFTARAGRCGDLHQRQAGATAHTCTHTMRIQTYAKVSQLLSSEGRGERASRRARSMWTCGGGMYALCACTTSAKHSHSCMCTQPHIPTNPRSSPYNTSPHTRAPAVPHTIDVSDVCVCVVLVCQIRHNLGHIHA